MKKLTAAEIKELVETLQSVTNALRLSDCIDKRFERRMEHADKLLKTLKQA